MEGFLMSQPFTDAHARRLAILWEDYKKRDKTHISYSYDYIAGLKPVNGGEYSGVVVVGAGAGGYVTHEPSEPLDDESTCICHCHKYEGDLEGIQCKCIKNCKHCNPDFKPSESDNGLKSSKNGLEPKNKCVCPCHKDNDRPEGKYCGCSEYHVKNNTNWEDEFDKLVDSDDSSYTDLVQFIKQQRLLVKKEMLERLKDIYLTAGQEEYDSYHTNISIVDLEKLLEEEE